MDCKDICLRLVGEYGLVGTMAGVRKALVGVRKALAGYRLTGRVEALVTMLLHAKVCRVGGLSIHAIGVGSLVLVAWAWWGMGLERSWLRCRG